LSTALFLSRVQGAASFQVHQITVPLDLSAAELKSPLAMDDHWDAWHGYTLPVSGSRSTVSPLDRCSFEYLRQSPAEWINISHAVVRLMKAMARALVGPGHFGCMRS
jgi:hypothetical protein